MTIATIITVIPLHSENTPAEYAFHDTVPISSGTTMVAGHSRRVSMPPSLELANSAPSPQPVRAHATAKDSTNRATAVCSAMWVYEV